MDRKEESMKKLYEFYRPEDKQDFYIAYLYMKHTKRFVKNTLEFLNIPANPAAAHPDESLDDLLKNYVRQIAEAAPDPKTNIYHGKVLSHCDAKKIVTLDRPVDIKVPEQVVPFAIARDVVLETPGAIAVGRCPCRAGQVNPCVPPEEQELCFFMGEPFASFITEHNPDFRRCSPDEAVSILEKAHKRGDVHTAYFKKEFGRRMMAICNCCSCCCMGMVTWNMLDGAIPFLAPSGYSAQLTDDCSACGSCVDDVCPFKAITAGDDGRPVVNHRKCMGCSVCIDACPAGAMKLVRDKTKGVPLDVHALSK